MSVRAVRVGSVAFRVADDEGAFWAEVEAGRWEPGALRFVAGFLGPGALTIDLGAWVGPFSLYAAALGARVIAVEPDPAALRDLRANLAVNPELAALITVVPRAVAPAPGPVRLGARRKPGDSMSSTLLAGSADSWTAEAVTPAELARLAGVPRRLLVKLDIEGGEYGVLPELGPLLNAPDTACLVSLHPAILAEAWEREPHARAAAALSIFAGWRARAVDGAGFRDASVTEAELDRLDQWLFERA